MPCICRKLGINAPIFKRRWVFKGEPEQQQMEGRKHLKERLKQKILEDMKKGDDPFEGKSREALLHEFNTLKRNEKMAYDDLRKWSQSTTGTPAAYMAMGQQIRMRKRNFNAQATHLKEYLRAKGWLKGVEDSQEEGLEEEAQWSEMLEKDLEQAQQALSAAREDLLRKEEEVERAKRVLAEALAKVQKYQQQKQAMSAAKRKRSGLFIADQSTDDLGFDWSELDNNEEGSKIQERPEEAQPVSHADPWDAQTPLNAQGEIDDWAANFQ